MMSDKVKKKLSLSMKGQGENIKRSLFKSIVYRIITVFLGILTALIVTGDIYQALSLGIATEFVQFINYFIFETIWSYYERQRLRQKFRKEFLEREIELKVNYSSIKELSYELSRLDTFVKSIYTAILNFYDGLLENEDLKELHEELSKHREYFVKAHAGRDF
ncbi:MAG: DUF2061 domain-containing protein [Promethearchaeota archaeon]|nr:MAG: DUF2061 domain-containing protein [Candidatus Lokiarchaeota archaeon]